MSKYGENIYRRKDGRWEARYIFMRLPNGKAKYKSVYLRRDRVHDHLRRHYESRVCAHVVEHDQLENHFKLLRHRPSGRSGARHCHVFLPVVDCRTHAWKARPDQDQIRLGRVSSFVEMPFGLQRYTIAINVYGLGCLEYAISFWVAQWPSSSTPRQLGKGLPKIAETLENTGEIIVILKGAACHIKAPKSYGFGAFSLFFGSKSSTYHAKI